MVHGKYSNYINSFKTLVSQFVCTIRLFSLFFFLFRLYYYYYFLDGTRKRDREQRPIDSVYRTELADEK